MTSWGQIIHLFTKLEELTERCEEYWSHVAMVRRRMMFCLVVGTVCGAGAPIKLKLLLVDAAILQPTETHIYGFGTFWLHPFVDDDFWGWYWQLERGWPAVCVPFPLKLFVPQLPCVH